MPRNACWGSNDRSWRTTILEEALEGHARPRIAQATAIVLFLSDALVGARRLVPLPLPESSQGPRFPLAIPAVVPALYSA